MHNNYNLNIGSTVMFNEGQMIGEIIEFNEDGTIRVEGEMGNGCFGMNIDLNQIEIDSEDKCIGITCHLGTYWFEKMHDGNYICPNCKTIYKKDENNHLFRLIK